MFDDTFRLFIGTPRGGVIEHERFVAVVQEEVEAFRKGVRTRLPLTVFKARPAMFYREPFEQNRSDFGGFGEAFCQPTDKSPFQDGICFDFYSDWRRGVHISLEVSLYSGFVRKGLRHLLEQEAESMTVLLALGRLKMYGDEVTPDLLRKVLADQHGDNLRLGVDGITHSAPLGRLQTAYAVMFVLLWATSFEGLPRDQGDESNITGRQLLRHSLDELLRLGCRPFGRGIGNRSQLRQPVRGNDGFETTEPLWFELVHPSERVQSAVIRCNATHTLLAISWAPGEMTNDTWVWFFPTARSRRAALTAAKRQTTRCMGYGAVAEWRSIPPIPDYRFPAPMMMEDERSKAELYFKHEGRWPEGLDRSPELATK